MIGGALKTKKLLKYLAETHLTPLSLLGETVPTWHLVDRLHCTPSAMYVIK